MRNDIVTAVFRAADGSEINWGAEGNHILTAVSGISGLTPEIVTVRSPLSDGDRLVRTRFPARVVTISGALLGDVNSFGQLRRMLMGSLNPKRGLGELIISGYGRTLRAPAYVSDMPILTEERKGMDWFNYVCELTVPGGVWLAENESVVTMQSFLGGFSFETTLPTSFATISGANTIEIDVESDVPCPVKMEFSGGSLNPCIENMLTGEGITVNTNIPQDSTLVIDTERGARTAYLRASDGTVTDAMGYLDVSTRFFDLQPGRNVIAFSADEGMAAEAVIRWTNRFAGF